MDSKGIMINGQSILCDYLGRHQSEAIQNQATCFINRVDSYARIKTINPNIIE